MYSQRRKLLSAKTMINRKKGFAWENKMDTPPIFCVCRGHEQGIYLYCLVVNLCINNSFQIQTACHIPIELTYHQKNACSSWCGMLTNPRNRKQNIWNSFVEERLE